MRVVAIVPIKHHSSRVPGKNYRMINGKPLFCWMLETLLATPEIEQIVIDTDSPTIKAGLCTHFPSNPQITVYDRPAALCGDSVSTNRLLENVISELKLSADYFVHAHVTNPLVRPKTISAAIAKLNATPGADSIFGVKVHHTRFYTKDGHDMNHNRSVLIPTQDLDPIYEENSCIYVFPVQTLLVHQARIGPKAIMLPMGDVESTDIDWPDDFEYAEFQLKKSVNG